MAWRHLGENFDIHGGGTDLIFPHHENELAQSVCAFPGSRFATVWLHNAMLNINGEKMSKSLGNFRTVREVLAVHPGEVIRLMLMRAHYRSILDFSDATLSDCRHDLDRFYRALSRTPPDPGARVPDAVMDALCEDLNTPLALAAMHALADAAMAGNPVAASGLKAAGDLLGLLQSTPSDWFHGQGDSSEIDALVAARLAARAARDFTRADAIRDQLLAMNIALEDRAGTTTWRRTQ